MELKVSPSHPLEWLALLLNRVPMPLLHGQMFPILSKAVLTAADKGVFRYLSGDSRTLGEISEFCAFKPEPARQLLGVLVSLGYLVADKGKYGLSAMAEKWLRTGSGSDLSDLLIYNNRVVWKWMEQLENYLETGAGIAYHQHFEEPEWQLYQRAMLAVARSEVNEFAKRCPVPARAARMLDIGGAHGLHVTALRSKYTGLEADILDLPGAWSAHPEPEAFNRMEGNILEVKLEDERYDLVLMSSLAHHFSEAENRMIARKVAASLKPGGIYVINEFVHPARADSDSGLVGTSSSLFFGLTSTSGTWTIAETQAWQAEAGLKPMKARRFRSVPGRVLMSAVRV